MPSGGGGRAPAFSVTLADCRVDTFRAGGNGGQNQNKRETGVRIVHFPSGARGESREERSQLQNKKKAFRRMAESDRFRAWVRRQQGEDVLLAAELNRLEMALGRRNLKTEIRENGQWVGQNPNR